MVPQPLLQHAERLRSMPVLQQVLQPVEQPVLQAVAQPVLQGVAATTAVPQSLVTQLLAGVAQLLTGVAQLLTGVAQRAAVRFARQVETRPLKPRPPKRLPLSQLVSQDWAKVVAVRATTATKAKTEDKFRTITFLLVTVPFDKTQERQIPSARFLKVATVLRPCLNPGSTKSEKIEKRDIQFPGFRFAVIGSELDLAASSPTAGQSLRQKHWKAASLYGDFAYPFHTIFLGQFTLSSDHSEFRSLRLQNTPS